MNYFNNLNKLFNMKKYLLLQFIYAAAALHHIQFSIFTEPLIPNKTVIELNKYPAQHEMLL